MITILGYIRVSDVKQVKDGHSLRNQRLQLEKWCEERSYRLLEILEDAGVSGYSKKKSDTFNKMIKMISEGQIDGVLCNKISRFGRRLSTTIETIELMRDNKVTFYTVDESINSDTSNGRFLINMFSSVAEMERENIVNNIKEVLNLKKENGEKFCRGIFGLKVVRGKFVKCNKEIKVRRRIKLLHNKGYSLGNIADRLNNDSIKTKLGRKWYRQSIKNVLETDLKQYIKS
jgi:DNA invertase Pin-like site-specific DNA recombinase|tara:strand:+ start:4643 stop:5335 length:693 start_codon:yes stop_codon:yes gene_type:complete